MTTHVLSLALALSTSVLGGSVAGRVTNAATGAGIGGVSVSFMTSVQTPVSGTGGAPVSVVPPPPAAAVVALTDDSGVFHVANIQDGQYLPLLTKDGFIGTLEPMVWNSIRVTGETRLDLQMTRLASLHGRVVGPDKMPVAGQAVLAQARFDLRAVTDENGEFVLENLSPQTLILSVPVKIPEDAKDGERMVTTYFPSTPERERAEQIEVRGVDLSGYEIRMQTALVRKIHGVVVDANDKPAAQATVGLTRRGPEGQIAEDVEQVLTGEDGQFEFTPVQEGEWRVQAENAPEYNYELNRPITRNASRLVRISAREPEKVEIRLSEPFALELSADWGDEGDPAAVHPKVMFSLAPLDRQPAYSGRVNLNEARRMEGLFPGRYSVQAQIPTPGYYLAAVLLNRRDILGEDVEISGPGTLTVVMRTGGGSVRGRVAGGGGGTVALMGPSGRFFWTPCNAEGEFAIGDLPPGEYSAGAFHLNPFQMPTNPDLKNALAANGQRVSVEPGGVASVELRLN
jgi:hypothetical protein